MKLAGSTKLLLLKFSPKYLPDIEGNLKLAGVESFDELFVSTNVLVGFQFFKV
jgi:hypothetical protein